MIGRSQVGQHRPVAHRVTGDHVDIDVKPRPAVRQQRQGDVEDLAFFDRQHLVRLVLAQLVQGLLDLRIAYRSEIHDVEHRAAGFGQHALRTVGQDLYPEHRMRRNQTCNGFSEL